MSDATRILQVIGDGDSMAASQLLPLVYDELRKIATQQMSRELPGNTLQPTALVHEAWLRLIGDNATTFENRAHFFAAAAEAMRRILIDRARRRRSLKRGGNAQFEPLDLENADVAVHADDQTLLLVNEALEKLAAEDDEAASLIKLRFFIGMTNQEAGQTLGISERTAKRHWTFARAWLYDEIRRISES
jgi:RNA polymerase sigma factor (TIGR02999 family)